MILRALIALCLLPVGCCPSIDGRESGADKQEWSILQGLEFDSRGRTLAGVVFESRDDYEAMAVQSTDGSTPVWILLKPQAAPFYKQLPAGSYQVSQATLDELVRDGRVSSTVEEVLRSHVQP
jgi:hypothetical protein